MLCPKQIGVDRRSASAPASSGCRRRTGSLGASSGRSATRPCRRTLPVLGPAKVEASGSRDDRLLAGGRCPDDWRTGSAAVEFGELGRRRQGCSPPPWQNGSSRAACALGGAHGVAGLHRRQRLSLGAIAIPLAVVTCSTPLRRATPRWPGSICARDCGRVVPSGLPQPQACAHPACEVHNKDHYAVLRLMSNRGLL